MRPVRRIEAVALMRHDRVTETAEKFRLYDALFARTGLQEYDDGAGGMIIEYRPDTEVFHADALASYELRPLTDLHPPSNLTTTTASVLARGAVSAGRIHEDGLHVAGRIAVWSDMPIDQLSAGYSLDLDETPGELADGRRYDAIQRNIRINHVAAVPLGRAGSARVLTDAADLAGSWGLGAAKNLADIAPHRHSRVIVDLGQWSRRDAADLRIQRVKETPPMKLKINIDGAPLELEVGDKATPQEIADAISKATAAGTEAKIKAAADALFEKKMSAEEEKAAEEKKKKEGAAKGDAAAFDARLETVRVEGRTHADALSVARVVLGLGYAGHDAAPAIQRDVVKAVTGADALTKIDAMPKADQSGALAFAFGQARDTYLAKPTHADALVTEINTARAARTTSSNRVDEIAAEVAKTAEQAAIPAHLRRARA